MPRPYHSAGLRLSATHPCDPALVTALQQDLRALGYLPSGLDGCFGEATERAIKALEIDLLDNDGSGEDGSAPVAVRSYNHGRVPAVTGAVTPGLAACIDAMLADPAWPKVPRADGAADARSRNVAAVGAIAAMQTSVAPAPFMLAIFRQESDGRHFAVPTAQDPDAFVILGLDRNDGAHPDRITSRGWGLGQYTIAHHPPRAEEISGFIRDPVQNVRKAFALLREKFDRFVVGPAARADDRMAEHPDRPAPRACKAPPGDPAFLRDCRTCAAAAPKATVRRGTPVFPGAKLTWQTTQYYGSADYADVPDRAAFPCDWPYAVRRYNGSGINSFHYQAHVLCHLLAEQDQTPGTQLLRERNRQCSPA